MEYYGNNDYRDCLAHFGVRGMHWGIRRFQPYSVTGARKGGKTGKEVGLAKRVGDGIGGIKKGIKKKITANKRKANLEKARAAKKEKQEILRSGSAKKMMENKEKFTTDEIEQFMVRANTETRLAELRKKQSEISFEKADQINDTVKKVSGYLHTINDLTKEGQNLYKNVMDVKDMVTGKEQKEKAEKSAREKAINSGNVPEIMKLYEQGKVNSQDLQNAINSIKNRKELEKTINGTGNDVERAVASGDPKTILDAWDSMDSGQMQQARKNAAAREWLEKKVSDNSDNKKTDQNSGNTEKKIDQNANNSTNEERATPANAIRGTRWETRNSESENTSSSAVNNDSVFKPVRDARDVTGAGSAFARVMDSRVSGYAESAFSKISDRRASTLTREEATNTGRREVTRIISGDTGSKKVSDIILPNSAPKNKPEIILPNSAPKNKPEIILPNSAPKNKQDIILPNSASKNNGSRITFDSASGQIKSTKKAKENADNLADRVNKVNSDSKKKRESKTATSEGIKLTLNPDVDPSSTKKASPKAWTEAANKRVDSYNASKEQLDRAERFTEELLKKSSDWSSRR